MERSKGRKGRSKGESQGRKGWSKGKKGRPNGSKRSTKGLKGRTRTRRLGPRNGKEGPTVCPAPSRAGHGRASSRQNPASKPNLDSRQHETSATPAGIQLSDLSKVELSSDQGLYPHLSDTIEPFKMLVKGALDQVKKTLVR